MEKSRYADRNPGEMGDVLWANKILRAGVSAQE
jgi:hypothetical protein